VFIELVDILRCLEPHEETWLVVAVQRMDGRHVIEGSLGCPVCHREYAIRDGVAYFAAAPSASRPTTTLPNPAEAIRLAAALALTDAASVAVLHGGWASHARLVRSFAPSQLLVLGALVQMSGGDGVSVIVSDVAPFAAVSVDAVALDAGGTPALAESLLRSLRIGGRMLAPATLPVPAEINELARDDEVWVGERIGAATEPIALTRRGSRA